jgi:hypothetical protein
LTPAGYAAADIIDIEGFRQITISRHLFSTLTLHLLIAATSHADTPSCRH